MRTNIHWCGIKKEKREILKELDNIYNWKILVIGPFPYLVYNKIILLAFSSSLVERDKKFRSEAREKLWY